MSEPTPLTDEATAPAFNADVPHAVRDRPLTPAARRATQAETALEPEHGGPRGPEPTRYGDWEKKGLAVDF